MKLQKAKSNLLIWLLDWKISLRICSLDWIDVWSGSQRPNRVNIRWNLEHFDLIPIDAGAIKTLIVVKPKNRGQRGHKVPINKEWSRMERPDADDWWLSGSSQMQSVKATDSRCNGDTIKYLLIVKVMLLHHEISNTITWTSVLIGNFHEIIFYSPCYDC